MSTEKINYFLEGKQSSITMDKEMFDVFSILCGSEDDARFTVREWIRNGDCVSTPKMNLSKVIQWAVFRECCRPSLIKRYDNDDHQTDIEDF